MPVSPERKAALMQKLPEAEVTRARAKRYMSAADLNLSQFSKLVGYSQQAVTAFLRGTYTTAGRIARTDLLVREKLEEYMARFPLDVESTTGDVQKLYETENVAVIRQWFDHCLQNRAMAYVYGAPGSQKSFVLQHLIASFNRQQLKAESVQRAFYVYVSVNVRPRDLLRAICAECGAPGSATLQGCLAALRGQLRHTQTLLVLDEAQHASIDALEAVRQLNDQEPRVGILLAGSHRLREFFANRAAELEQWNSRIDAGVELPGVADATARAIFRAECPGLGTEQVEALISGSRASDPYSSKKNHTYLSMRRVFKAIAAVHTHQHSQPAPSSEVVQ